MGNEHLLISELNSSFCEACVVERGAYLHWLC